ncbi:MAG: translation elongation factor Ts [Deltaproteobacteria bacterium RIFCSPLOWO2_12_FULL_44_12]|nr:MAG: translation elongation factor Ts [Deltaproteobacteria bacterium RIFCSPHIGHO2_01_FULL_43_49]OGQ15469.1 MAG: translation elongation factor Ts [Deltaproteobacteria bacterium RIFCSPHIGHO2_02_FULL_44_53]OGQ29662.1 MAG: translation elongation factor Ts [Deltaproteobacteria bacterium RIFCSPHIGHO2_12_FULL_44_21]OGQ32275.1 MAG: translation elongation factor Ts [Deltaproteobacteria bacterium RIFCSPLOWO2_01_FULL_45_74]OGQ43918.1 MAG: translation elongation factor Ts [Deltaproteobacteria bacterium 
MITSTAVKELRDKTNAGMMDCKKALEEAKGNIDQAIEILRKKGLSIAQKKSGRLAHEGILGTHYNDNGKLGLIVEVNCETDFVVKTDDFQKFVTQATDLVHNKAPKNIEELQSSLQETVTSLIAKIGENIQVRRFARWEAKSPQEKIGFYLHAGSKIGVLTLVSDKDSKVDVNAAKEIAMHIAAMHPKYVRREEVPAEVVAKEKEIQAANVDPKKPAAIREKIVEGKLGKFYSEVCLEEQVFVKDPEGKKTVRDWLKSQSPNARIEKFARLQVGET